MPQCCLNATVVYMRALTYATSLGLHASMLPHLVRVHVHVHVVCMPQCCLNAKVFICAPSLLHSQFALIPHSPTALLPRIQPMPHHCPQTPQSGKSTQNSPSLTLSHLDCVPQCYLTWTACINVTSLGPSQPHGRHRHGHGHGHGHGHFL